MNRRSFLKALGLAPAAVTLVPHESEEISSTHHLSVCYKRQEQDIKRLVPDPTSFSWGATPSRWAMNGTHMPPVSIDAILSWQNLSLDDVIHIKDVLIDIEPVTLYIRDDDVLRFTCRGYPQIDLQNLNVFEGKMSIRMTTLDYQL